MPAPPPPPPRRASGFTLLEMVMVIIILGVMAGVGTPVLMAAYQSFLLGSNIQEADTRARLAMERMLRELRGASIASLTDGADASSITFTDQNGASVTFQRVSGNLQRGGVLLAEGVSGLRFVTSKKMPPVEMENDPTPWVTIDMTVIVAGQGLSLRGGVSPLNP